MHARTLPLLLLCAVSAAHAQFSAPRTLTELHPNNHAQRTALFDADGDGDLDMLLASSHTITLRRNDGSGLFMLYEENHLQESDPVNLAWGDVDADGDIDLVQAAWTADSALTWLSNDGDGHFELEQVLLGNGGEDQQVSLADLDDDGDLDLFLGAYGGGRMFRNNGAGSFDPGQLLSDQAHLGIPADVDLDGDLDLVGIDPMYDDVGYSPDTGAGYGTWQEIGPANSAVRQLLIVDLELDGDSDLVYLDPIQLVVHVNLDSGLFAPAVLLPGGGPDLMAARAGDLTGDGIPDLVVIDQQKHLLIFANNGDASFAPATTWTPLDAGYGAEDLALADADDDGLLDVIAVRRSSVHCHMGDGAGGFSGTRVVLPDMYNGAATGDMDGDGDEDILLSSAWLEQSSPGTFTLMRTIYVGAPRQSAADFTGDGLMDTYTSREDYQEADSVAWFHNLGGGQFERIELDDTWPNTWNAQAWDLDMDGDLDLLQAVNESGVGVVRDYRNDGAGHLLPAQYDLSGGNDQILHPAIADFDGDGDPDVACYQYWGPFSIYENEGGPYLSSSPTHELGTFTEYVRFAYAGDIDGDGDQDLVFEVNGDLYWYGNNGLGNTWTPHTIASNIDDDGGQADLGDIDADGDLDVMYRVDQSQVVYRVNGGTGNFGSPITIPLTEGLYQPEVDLVDLDADGDADLIIQAGQEVRLHMNTTIDIPTALPLPKDQERPILRPNPFEEGTTLELGTPLTATDQVRILDISGRVLRTIRGMGTRLVPIERGELKAGVYVLHVMHGDRSSSVRMVVR